MNRIRPELTRGDGPSLRRNPSLYAGMVELVDSEDLGSSVNWRVGSSPTTRTNEALTWILIGKLPPAEQCAS